MEQKQANAISYPHYVSSLACVSRSCQHFQESRKTKPSSFSRILWSAVSLPWHYTADQRAQGHQELKSHPSLHLPLKSPLNKPFSHPKKTAALIYCWLRKTVPNSNKQTKSERRSLAKNVWLVDTWPRDRALKFKMATKVVGGLSFFRQVLTVSSRRNTEVKGTITG